MELCTLDSLFRRAQVIDKFESSIWTERFSGWGDIELQLNSTIENRTLFVPGVRLVNNESYRVMVVETVEDKHDEEGRAILKVKGRSIEKILEERLAMAELSDLTSYPRWDIEGLPLDIAAQIFHDICVIGVLDPGDIIPGVTEGSIFPADTISAPTEEIIYSIDTVSVYQAIKDLCDEYMMGFRLIRDIDTSFLYFDIYMGSDRTAQQTVLPAVIFSPDLENLRNTTLLTSTALYRNVAYVVSPVGHEIVYPLDVDPLVEGFERRVLFVRADDIDDVVPADASAKMIQRGKEGLAKARRFTAFDGELAQTNQYRYGVDYNLGDLVEIRDDDGATSIMQVTEQIFVSDREGERSFPTLSVNEFITPGSWLDMAPTLVWDDMTTEEWDDMP